MKILIFERLIDTKQVKQDFNQEKKMEGFLHSGF